MTTFTCRGQSVTLAPGDHFAVPREIGFRDTASADLHALIAEIRAGRPWREAVNARYERERPWLHRIIADPRRTAFFGQVLPAGSGPVLDLGAGWGQIARPLAQHRPVVALEPVAERLGFIQAAAQQDGILDRLSFIGADYLECDFSSRFAAICAIGVLEWAGAFQDQVDPQQRQRDFLAKTHRDLAAGGTLVLGIENRTGLKYLLGCPDDHIGVANIATLSAPLARARYFEKHGGTLKSFTYTLSELAALLREAGFAQIHFFAAFPDYKLPDEIIPLAYNGRELNAWLRAAAIPREHNGYDGVQVHPEFQETLENHYRSFAAEGLAQHFVPSFFVAAHK